MEQDEKYKESFKIIKFAFLVNTVLLLPCAYLTIFKLISANPDSIWSFGFLGLTLPIVLLRCFYLPYIFTVVLSIIYLKYLIQLKFPIKDLLLFILLITICILGLLSLEEVFLAAMGI